MSATQRGVAAPHRGRTLAFRRGRVLGQAPSASPGGGRQLGGILALLVLLPMFAQCFHYMTDIPPLYILSKVWPFLTLPFAVWALMSLDVPFRALQVSTLFWLLAVTPVIGILHLGNGFVDAMATTAKVWPFTYAFSALGVLVLLHPGGRTLRGVILGLGLGTYVVMALLWVAVPVSAYGGGDLETKLFMNDVERGYRIYMPMFFGILLVLYLNRSAWIRFAWWKPIAIAGAFILLLTIYKQRLAIAGAVLAVVVGSILRMTRWRAAAFTGLGLLCGAGGMVVLIRAQMTAELQTTLGASLAVREVSMATAWTYISADPIRWIFGVGGTTRLGDVTLGRLFNNPMFFLTDIGWLGVLFEYGLIGVILILLIHFAALRHALRRAPPDDALAQALADYVVYLLAVSFVYSVVFTPGELMTVVALSSYLARVAPGCGAGQGIASSQPARPMPRHRAAASARPSGLPGGPPSGSASKG